MTTIERSDIDYAKDRLRRNYTGYKLSPGAALTVGLYYRLSSYDTRDDFSNIGSTNAGGEIFQATGTTPAAWAFSVLNEIKVADLRTDADITFNSVTEFVTLTSSGYEGGTGSGQITFEKKVLGKALEELIKEFDPDWSAPVTEASGSVIQLSL